MERARAPNLVIGSANTLTEDPDYPDIRTRIFRIVLSGYPIITKLRIGLYKPYIYDNNLSDGKYAHEI